MKNCSFLNIKNFNIIPEKCFSHITSRGIPVFRGWFQGDSQGPKGFCRVPGVGRGLEGPGRTRQSQVVLELVPTFSPCRFFLVVTKTIVTLLCITNTHFFYNKRQIKIGKKLSKAKQHPEAELSLFENYLLSSYTLSSVFSFW